MVGYCNKKTSSHLYILDMRAQVIGQHMHMLQVQGARHKQKPIRHIDTHDGYC